MLDSTKLRPGMQLSGSSSDPIYQFALRRISKWPVRKDWKVVDVGGGRGDFAKMLLATFDNVTVLDCVDHPAPQELSYIVCDLNGSWPLPSCFFDAVVSLE